MNETDDVFDLITLVMVLAIFTPIMVYCALPFFKGDVGGFGVQIEKSARSTESEIDPIEYAPTAGDLLLMLVVADANTPQPKKLQMDFSGVQKQFVLDDLFFSDRSSALQLAKGVLPAALDTPVRLRLFAGPAGMRFWNADLQP